ncbi:MAG: hypothetical protein ACTSP7_07615 [Candidatus Heimdallarchaeota archaeon]
MSQINRNVTVGFVIALVIIFGCLALIFTPFSTSTWSDSGKDYTYKIHFFGHWSIDENTTQINDGGSADLVNFPMASPVLIFIGITMSFFFVSSLGFSFDKRRKIYKVQRQIIGALVILSGAFGLAGALVFRTYLTTIRATYENTSLGTGFIIAMLLFSFIILLGIGFTIFGRLDDKPTDFANEEEPEIKSKE